MKTAVLGLEMKERWCRKLLNGDKQVELRRYAIPQEFLTSMGPSGAWICTSPGVMGDTVWYNGTDQPVYLLQTPDGNVDQPVYLLQTPDGNVDQPVYLLQTPDGNVDQPVYLLQTPDGNEGQSTLPAEHMPAGFMGACVAGCVVFSGQVKYSSFEQWLADRAKHCVPPDTPYSWQPGETREMFGWQIESVEAASPTQPVPAMRRVLSSWFKVEDS